MGPVSHATHPRQTVEVVDHASGNDIVFEPIGAVELKGFVRPVTLHRATPPGATFTRALARSAGRVLQGDTKPSPAGCPRWPGQRCPQTPPAAPPRTRIARSLVSSTRPSRRARGSPKGSNEPEEHPGVALGIFSAIGGFVDIGDLVFNTQAGA
jgi:hypothetical protein